MMETKCVCCSADVKKLNITRNSILQQGTRFRVQPSCSCSCVLYTPACDTT